MATTTPSDEKPSTRDRSGNPRPDYIILGTDRIGNEHLYRTKDETVFIMGAGGYPVDRHYLAGRPLDDYREFVADRRGWQDYGLRIPTTIEDPFSFLRRNGGDD